MSKTMTLRISDEDNQAFTDYAKAYKISKQSLIVNATKFAIIHSDVLNGVLVPTFTVEKILNSFKQKLIAECDKRVALLDEKALKGETNES
jgi:hypothetical protein